MSTAIKFRSSLALLVLMLAFAAGASSVAAQSVSQDFPTPITSNEITGVIPARDVGDSRLTTFYYKFEGSVGDVFVNVSTKNFSGDIDIFADNGLRPLSKIVVYADFAENETGRVIYLRKPEKLILRIQGRSPGDDPASYRIKFAGSFVAMSDSGAPSAPETPKVTAQTDTGIRVNSVGTIIAVTPKPKPVESTAEERAAERTAERKENERTVKVEEEKAADDAKMEKPAPEVVTTENLPRPEVVVPRKSREAAKRTPPARTAAARRAARPAKVQPAEPIESTADPLANIHLVIQFKDGKTIERPMNEVFKFSVDKGVLTVISKDGSIGRFSILDVEKVTIQ